MPATRVFLVLIAASAAGPSSVAPVAAAPPPKSTCPLPATDLCTDYVWRGARWTTLPVPFHINLATPLPGAEQDVLDALAAWENEVKSSRVEAAYPGDGSSVSFANQGPTTAGPVADGRNTVYIGPTNGGVAGAAVRIRKGRILEFDISINTSYAWTTDLSCPLHDCGARDLQNVLTHEIGHVLDLYHVSEEAQAELTMAPGAGPDETKKRDLGAGEVLALRRIYPG